MNSKFLELELFIGVLLVALVISLFLHEFGHYLAYRHYKGYPRFGFHGKWTKLTIFITSIYGDDFYWDLYNSDRSNAWKKQIIISGSGLFTTLAIALITSSYWIFLLIMGNKVFSFLSFTVLMIGVMNFLIFFGNIFNPSSDGYKIKMALKYRKTFVDHLEQIGYQFTADHLKPVVEKICQKHKKST